MVYPSTTSFESTKYSQETAASPSPLPSATATLVGALIGGPDRSELFGQGEMGGRDGEAKGYGNGVGLERGGGIWERILLEMHNYGEMFY